MVENHLKDFVRWSVALMFIGVLTACGRPSQEASAPASAPVIAAAPSTPPSAVAPLATKQEWLAAVNGVYTKTDTKPDDEGVVEFMACFESGTPKCSLRSWGKRDEFRKVSHFTPVQSSFVKYRNEPYLHSYVALVDCTTPNILLNPRFKGDSWMFMTKVAVMADGELVLEQDVTNPPVQRDTYPGLVEESGTWIASDADLEALRKIAAAKAVVVRLSGEKGYVTVGKKLMASFQEDVRDALAIHDKLLKAAETRLPAACK